MRQQLLRLRMPRLWSNERLQVVPLPWPVPRLRRCVEYSGAPSPASALRSDQDTEATPIAEAAVFDE